MKERSRPKLFCMIFGHRLYGDTIESAPRSWSMEVDGKKIDRVDSYKMKACSICRTVILGRSI